MLKSKAGRCILIGLALTVGAGERVIADKADTATATDRDIKQIVRDIDAGRIETTIRKLVSFGTRNTLSAQDDPQHGIGAARDWLYEEFSKLRTASGNRLRVEKQTFLQPVAARVPRPTPLTNIVATLPGDLPEDRQRYVVVSGHYDSMCSDPTDAVHDAPGANDDASGTAAVLEMARVMSCYHFHATIVFMTVVGEEQGLLGSTYFAKQARQNDWRIEGMFTKEKPQGCQHETPPEPSCDDDGHLSTTCGYAALMLPINP